MKVSIISFATMASWAFQFAAATDGDFCSRADGGESPNTFFYAVQIESDQSSPGLCGGLWDNLNGRNGCGLVGSFHGCQQQGDTWVVDGKTMYRTWWWFATPITCDKDTPTWVADQATVMDLTWRYGAECQWRQVTDVKPELLLDDTKWL